ncbi:NAD(P)/FAD-dependent oxidoreductase [Gordonia metallireducens]|uniref:NAD(P)/FAD-dependent oxidoreductase n=1 Tax=Gordonia metallireducens TaxID=2897779 RepID=UPI001E29B700|nr:FAD-dependent oxidoreductase [Gordonia metallireducens]
MSTRVVIAGGSVAGIRMAKALRQFGFTGTIQVFEAEHEVPYDKPPLSKLAVDSDPHVPLITRSEAQDLGVELHLGRAVAAVRPGDDEIDLDDGAVVRYDHLVIATGAKARPSPWTSDGVYVLRGIDDARTLRERLTTSRRLLIIGAGFIGSEVAALARANDLEVTIVDSAPIPMARVVGDELGKRFVDLHHAHGVTTKFGVAVHDMTRADGSIRTLLSDGSEIRTDTVLVGIGASLNTEWLAGAGLADAEGVRCDEYGRALGHANISAIGDVSAWFRPSTGAHSRIEHWTNGIEQAAAVAARLAGKEDTPPHDPVAYVWSDQYDWRIHLFGIRPAGVDPEVTEEADPFRLVAVWRDGSGEVTGGMAVNWPRESVRLRKSIAARNASRASSHEAVTA